MPDALIRSVLVLLALLCSVQLITTTTILYPATESKAYLVGTPKPLTDIGDPNIIQLPEITRHSAFVYKSSVIIVGGQVNSRLCIGNIDLNRVVFVYGTNSMLSTIIV